MEVWKDVVGYEGLYKINNFGDIKMLPKTVWGVHFEERLMKTRVVKNGYLDVGLRNNGVQKRYLVHRLVGLAFIPNPQNLPQINHKDENKSNNDVNNLEWCTASYNVNYGSKVIRTTLANKIPIVQLDLNENKIQEFDSAMDCERMYGFNHRSIAKCCKGQLTKYRGYKWKYKEEFDNENTL